MYIRFILPYLPAEYQVEGLSSFMQLRGNVQYIFVGCQWHGESIALYDAIETELLLFGLGRHTDQLAEFRYHIGDDGAAPGVHHPLGTSRQPVDLTSGASSGADSSHLTQKRTT